MDFHNKTLSGQNQTGRVTFPLTQFLPENQTTKQIAVARGAVLVLYMPFEGAHM